MAPSSALAPPPFWRNSVPVGRCRLGAGPGAAAGRDGGCFCSFGGTQRAHLPSGSPLPGGPRGVRLIACPGRVSLPRPSAARSPGAGFPRHAPRATFPARAPEAQARGLWRGLRPAADGRPGPQVRGSSCSAPGARADPERPRPGSCRPERASGAEAGPGSPGRPSSRTLCPGCVPRRACEWSPPAPASERVGGGGCLLAGAAGSDLSSLCGGDGAVGPPGRSSHYPEGLGCPLSAAGR